MPPNTRAGWRGGDDCPGEALAWPPAVALRRAGEDAPPAPNDGGGDERGLETAVAGGRAESVDTAVNVRAAASASEHGLMSWNRIRHQYQSAGEPLNQGQITEGTLTGGDKATKFIR